MFTVSNFEFRKTMVAIVLAACIVGAAPSALSKNDGDNGNGSNVWYHGPLSSANVGDTVVFYINSQQYKNAAFTSLTEKETNANWIDNAIEQSLGLQSPIPGYIPSVKAGDDIYLMNGVAGQKKLASDPDYTALVNKKVLFLPVISGNPPFNQSQKCIGFIAVRVTDVEINQSGGVVESITCKIIRAIGPGTSTTPIDSGNATNDQALVRLAPGPIKLTL